MNVMTNVEISHAESDLSQMKQVKSLLESAFQYSPSNNVSVDFYPLLYKGNVSHNLIASVEGKVVGHMGIKERTLKIRRQEFPIILLGGIAVDQKYQGQGVLSKMFEAAISKYTGKCLFFFLWSNLAELYQKFEFHQMGGLIQTGNRKLDFSLLKGFQQTNLKSLYPQDFEKIKKIYELSMGHWTSLKRSVKDWEELKEITSAQLFIHRNEENEIDQYFIFQKGQDLTQIIHEIGAEKPSLLRELIDKLKSFQLWVPESFSDRAPTDKLLYGMMGRIGSWDMFQKFLNVWSMDKVQLINKDHQALTFEFDGNIYREEIENFLPMLFGPNPVQEFMGLCPPLFISGLDSI